MYKFENAENSSVCIPSAGVFCIHPGTYRWKEYEEWVANGGETLPWRTEEELLEEARQRKVAEINATFQAAELNPVSVGGHAYKGGFQSGLAIDAQRRAMVEYAGVNPHAGITTVMFFDVAGTPVTLPLASDTEIDALDVCLAIHQSASVNSFKCAQLVAAAMAAPTVADVEAIQW
ncbi:MAG: hypothetical protein Q4G66_07655 [bacterium]|nr:hypothetical protein [bacterium]